MPILDLTLSNPTAAGFAYPFEEISQALQRGAASAYDPDPKGLIGAREAVAAYYAGQGANVDPGSVLLTSGTSEAYALLIKLLCDPGDRILTPAPSYPLVEVLADLEGVETDFYRLSGPEWRLNAEEMSAAVRTQTRALVFVSPNNPTGTMLENREMTTIATLATKTNMGLIVDEVFFDYPSRGRETSRVSSVMNREGLTFTFGGLSKAGGMPQLKCSWIVAGGPAHEVERALERLEYIADAYLSVSTPVQQALPALLELAPQIRSQILERLAGNEDSLRRILGPETGATVHPRQGGWYSMISLPDGLQDESFTLRMIKDHGILTHPGYLFGTEDDGLIVVSLLAARDVFEEGILQMAKTFLQWKDSAANG